MQQNGSAFLTPPDNPQNPKSGVLFAKFKRSFQAIVCVLLSLDRRTEEVKKSTR
jgi:hypothetical protein